MMFSHDLGQIKNKLDLYIYELNGTSVYEGLNAGYQAAPKGPTGRSS
jgi:hypothetical protein